MTVLITGGCGFIGSYLARDLVRDGHDVVVTDVRGDELLRDIVGTDLGADAVPPAYFADVANVPGLVDICRRHGVTSIVHTAGLLSDGCEAGPAYAAAVNLVGTASVFEVAGALDIEHIVWTSSISVFGYVASDATIPDDAPHAPTTFYGLYKSTNEAQARLYHERLGLPSTGIRVGFAFGYGRSRGRGSWVHELLGKPALGQPGRVQGGDALVPWLYVEDASAALAKAVTAPPDGARVFNTQGTSRWKREAVDHVRRLLPDADLELVGEPQGYPTGLDDRRIREELGWSPQSSMEDGILRSVNRYRVSAGLDPIDAADDGT